MLGNGEAGGVTKPSRTGERRLQSRRYCVAAMARQIAPTATRAPRSLNRTCRGNSTRSPRAICRVNLHPGYGAWPNYTAAPNCNTTPQISSAHNTKPTGLFPPDRLRRAPRFKKGLYSLPGALRCPSNPLRAAPDTKRAPTRVKKTSNSPLGCSTGQISRSNNSTRWTCPSQRKTLGRAVTARCPGPPVAAVALRRQDC